MTLYKCIFCRQKKLKSDGEANLHPSGFACHNCLEEMERDADLMKDYGNKN